MRKEPNYFFADGQQIEWLNMADVGDAQRENFSPADWELIKDLVYTCQTSPPRDLDRYLREQRVSDGIRAEVFRLLRASSDCGAFLSESATEKHLGVSMHQPLRFGRYRVMDQIGSGGSGVVYAAWDESLNRKVAVKVLRPEVAQNPELQKRLRWDARAASALQHPNIVVVHEVGSDGGVDYIAMECISGQTLGERIATGPLNNREALNLGIQICSGLEAAHAAGIVHRDLKPGNIMITDQGVVKLLDFGLAKHCDGGFDTKDAPETVEGRFAGTVAYVSPEQADAKPVDARSDIFSFGSVLYEMLTGRQAFPGNSTVSVLADIMLTNPRPPQDVYPKADPAFQHILSRCMRKDRERRYQSIAEVRVRLRELEEQILHPESQNTVILPGPGILAARSARTSPAKLAAGALAVAALAAAGTWYLFRTPPPTVPLFTISRITADRGLTGSPAISRDGSFLAYASDRAGQHNLDIWLQRTNGNDLLQLTKDSANEDEPAFSPDGSLVVFHSDRDGGGLYTVSTLSGAPRLLVSGGHAPKFSPDGRRIAYWTGEMGASLKPGSVKIYIIPTVGGVPQQFRPEFDAAAFPVWSPQGDRILFLGRRAADKGSLPEWWTAPLGEGPPHSTGLTRFWSRYYLNRLPATGAYIVPSAWLPDNTLVFAARQLDSTNIWAASLRSDGTPLGEPYRLTAGTTDESHPAVALNSGHLTMAYESTTSDTDVWEVPLDAQGRPTGSPHPLITGYAAMSSSSLSRDGARLVFSSKHPSQLGSLQSLYLWDLHSGEHSDFAGVPSHSAVRPVVSGDGKSAAYWADKVGYRIPTAGGAAQKICEHCGPPTHLSFDGSAALFESASDPDQILYVSGGAPPKPLVALDAPRFTNQSGARFSPDQRWIVFSAGNFESGAKQIFVAPLHPSTLVTPAELIPITEGTYNDIEPYWGPDGKTIFFISNRDGFRCVWARRVNDDARPSGPVYEVAPFHQTGHVLFSADSYTGSIGLSVGGRSLVVTVLSSTGDVWLRRDTSPPH